jgi:deoxyribodipyrimidine photolyase-related protein
MIRRTIVWILGDQLLGHHPALQLAEDEDGRAQVAVVLVESRRRLEKRPYQRKKLVLLLSAMRHYAAELRERGYQVQSVQAQTFERGLAQVVAEWRAERLLCLAASDRSGRRFQNGRLQRALPIPVQVLPNSQFLTATYDPYPAPEPGKRYVMEYFYRHMRRHFDVLMDGDEPVGGRWNYDRENRLPLPKDVDPPAVIAFEPDDVTRQVLQEVAAFDGALGTVQGFDLAVTRAEAQRAADDFFNRRLVDFGPYEDAMSGRHHYLYHSNLSAYLNLGLLEPMELIRRAEQAFAAGDAPINSVEGFIRQILGWREYIYWQYWRLGDDLVASNFWGANRPLPGFFWDGQCDMNCLGHVVRRAMDSGYNHHIERLMILCNFALLAGLAPLEVNEWFLSTSIDAYEWVMTPNVLGMGLNADGGLVATKPYIASANYINKMSDYCGDCRYDHKQRTGEDACPFNTLYWSFLIRHEETLRANPRLGPNVLGLRYLDQDERAAVQESAGRFLARLDATS